MASLVRSDAPERADGRPQLVVPASAGRRRALEAAHRALLADAEPRIHRFLKSAHRVAQGAYAGAGATDAADRLATGVYVANVVVGLAAEGELDATDARIAVDTLAEARGEPVQAATLRPLPHRLLEPARGRAAAAGRVRDPSPPARPARHRERGVALEGRGGRRSSRSSRSAKGAASRRARATARAALRRGGLTLLGSRTLRSSLVRRFSTPCAVVVARVPEPISRADAFLSLAASALAPIFERELLLERSAEREQMLVSAGEQRLMRIGFDLHDGPIQDVLALGADIAHLREQVYPFILDSHRERAAGRFDDLLARSVELDRQLREISARSSRGASSRGRSGRRSTARSTRSPSARASTRASRSAATPSRSRPRSGSPSIARSRSRSRTCASTPARPPSRSGSACGAPRSRCASSTTGTASRSAGRSPAPPSAAGSGSSASASACACSADRSRSTAPRRADDAHLRAPAGRPRRAPLGPLERLTRVPRGPPLAPALSRSTPRTISHQGSSIAEDAGRARAFSPTNDEGGGRPPPSMFALPTPHDGASDVGRGTRYG